MDHSIRPLDSLTLHEVVAMAEHAAHAGEPLDQANVFSETHYCDVFAYAYHVHTGSAA